MRKTLSVEMIRARDCDIRAVTDSVPEVIRVATKRVVRVVFKAHLGNVPEWNTVSLAGQSKNKPEQE